MMERIKADQGSPEQQEANSRRTVKIGEKIVGDGHPTFIVAEIGINHNGDINIAKKLIDVAVENGCDAVKFQKRTIDVVYAPEELAKPRENPFGATNGDLKRGLEFGEKEYKEKKKTHYPPPRHEHA